MHLVLHIYDSVSRAIHAKMDKKKNSSDLLLLVGLYGEKLWPKSWLCTQGLIYSFFFPYKSPA